MGDLQRLDRDRTLPGVQGAAGEADGQAAAEAQGEARLPRLVQQRALAITPHTAPGAEAEEPLEQPEVVPHAALQRQVRPLDARGETQQRVVAPTLRMVQQL